MVSDAERRNVAQKLRHEARNPSVYSTYTMLRFITRAKTGEELLFRLANLIEPPTQCPYYHSDRHHCSAYDDVVDRDALLKLADEMDYGYNFPDVAHDYAMRIRKACGVKDDA